MLATNVDAQTAWTVASSGAERVEIVLVPIADRFIPGETFGWHVRLGD